MLNSTSAYLVAQSKKWKVPADAAKPAHNFTETRRQGDMHTETQHAQRGGETETDQEGLRETKSESD